MALPWQNLSAVTLPACGVGHHDMFMGRSAGHGHAGHVAMAHPAALQSGEAAGAIAAHCDPGKASLTKASCHPGSACASCCVGAALAPTPIAFDPVVLTDPVAPEVGNVQVAFLCDGLERPPRTFLA